MRSFFNIWQREKKDFLAKSALFCCFFGNYTSVTVIYLSHFDIYLLIPIHTQICRGLSIFMLRVAHMNPSGDCWSYMWAHKHPHSLVMVCAPSFQHLNVVANKLQYELTSPLLCTVSAAVCRTFTLVFWSVLVLCFAR